MSFKFPELNYDYDALEPYIDARTMEIHHTKHHGGYTNKLNAAIKGTALEGLAIEEVLLKGFDNPAIRNNGGGYYNHCFFWQVISPNGGGEANGKVGDKIINDFGSFDAFKDSFSKEAAARFGSGWAWLCLKDGKLCICSTANQDNTLMPISCEGTPILGLDVWEHAYYLKYQNRRPEYIQAFFNIINWDKVNENLEKACNA